MQVLFEKGTLTRAIFEAFDHTLEEDEAKGHYNLVLVIPTFGGHRSCYD